MGLLKSRKSPFYAKMSELPKAKRRHYFDKHRREGSLNPLLLERVYYDNQKKIENIKRQYSLSNDASGFLIYGHLFIYLFICVFVYKNLLHELL